MCVSSMAFTQTGNVGINTDVPSATLDINGNLKIRTTPASTTLANFTVLGVNNTSKEVTSLDASLFNTGTATPNTTLFSARRASSGNLLSLTLFPSGFRSVQFVNANRTVGSTSVFNDTDHTYVVPSAGVYHVEYTFRYGSGLQASVLSNPPGIAIVRVRAGVATLIDSRIFSGANLGLVNLTVSESSISSVYEFQSGDKIAFGLTEAGVLDAGLLDSSVTSFTVYKVSNPIP